jgi:RNA recognition motif-containing protein
MNTKTNVKAGWGGIQVATKDVKGSR